MDPGYFYGVAFALGALSWFASSYSGRSSASSIAGQRAGISLVSIVVPVAILLYGVVAGVQMAAFYEAHWNGPTPGSVRYGAENELARYHIQLAILCFVVAANMAWRLARKTMASSCPCGLAGIGAGIVAAMTFFMTLPHGGDEGVLFWVLITPAVLLTTLVLVSLSIAAIVIGIRRQRRSALSGSSSRADR